MTIDTSRDNTIVENTTESIDSYGSSATERTASTDRGPSTEVRRYTSLSRKNGWSWPLHPRQVIAWLVLVFIISYYFVTIATALWTPYIYPAYIIPGVFALIHIITQFGCVSINPADPNVRGRDLAAPLPSFDRTQHAHVIENLYCNICETNVTDEAKHCSYCNKCIEAFDHHCFWLNNCIGGRNYRTFILCLISALLFCVIVVGVDICEIVLYFFNIELLYSGWHSAMDEPTTPIPSSSLSRNNSISKGHLFIYIVPSSEEAWISIAFFYLVFNLLAIGLIGHLLGFHIYLISQNLSTYSYIMRMREREIAKQEMAQAKDTPSCSAKTRGRVAPSENGPQENQSNGENNRPGLSDEEKRSFGMELRNGVGEKSSQRSPQQSTNSAWEKDQPQTLPTYSRSTPSTNLDGRILPLACKRPDVSACEVSPSGEGILPEKALSDRLSPDVATRPRDKSRKKRNRRAETDPPLPPAGENRNYELGMGLPNESGATLQPQKNPYGLNQRRRSAGADSGVTLSPGLLPPLVNSPTHNRPKSDDVEVNFGSPLTEIPIDDLKSFYRSEIQYVNFA